MIQVPVQAVLAERDHRGRAVAPDERDDLARGTPATSIPPQVAVGMVQQDDFGDAEHRGGRAQLARAHASEIAVRHRAGSLTDRASPCDAHITTTRQPASASRASVPPHASDSSSGCAKMREHGPASETERR